jgi:hypothetical protein
MLNEFILNALKWDSFASNENIEKLEHLSSMRNPAAYAKSFNLKDAKDVRDRVFEVFSSLTS